ncbi:LysR family transcriptional regulator [Sinorhizobium meliloti]|uniref:LysR family transcriptional regulator n=1 Tax=Rhizobium meliloti TaxID=382 RepID=UPI000B49988E|nr:LysR family transcriptional regulator [Sinorhizobium meliloti]ASP93480.1 LysR family transcriptional regulator [Sinorhizobium meliloti]MQX55318.1 LysR family transcriptional regulator [Sinorhizobium meliloti]RVJ68642.1 LysR family transcriptional regulator [Sinorhizobium meliloti]RVJ85821.1 LysR family transcriptional regulator [Sinorhizobium meliloti]
MTFGFDLDLLRTFTAVVETGGFTRAADRVHLTQSTISQQIKKLETNLGHVLLIRDRATGSVRTTEEGELLMSYARRILSVSVEANEALGRSVPLPKTVRLGVPEDFAGKRLIDLLSGFSRTSPGARLDTVSGWSFELRRLLHAGEIDLALVKREPGDGACIAKWEERLVWVGDPLLAAGNDPVPLAVFPAGCIYRERVIRAMERGGKTWRIAYSSQGLMGVQAAVASGLGISLLPNDAVLPEHRLLHRSDGFLPEPSSELALIAIAKKLEPAVQDLVDYLLANLRAMKFT